MKSQCELDEGQPGQRLGLAQALYPVDDRGRACRRRRRNQSSKCSAQTLLRPPVLLPERLALMTSMLLRPTIGLGPVRSWRLVFSGSKHHWRRNRPSLESQIGNNARRTGAKAYEHKALASGWLKIGER